jgi:flavin reductase (DIM6/NTAB) family NADH-FMN oxidoreductase RutF
MSHTADNSDKTRALRVALGQFATGVAVVTAIDLNGQPVGMTINSFSSVSLKPALVSWCIDRRAASYATFTRARRFALTVLSTEQADLALRFATRGADKFRGIDIDDGQAPVIANACAWFRCESYRSIALGDHQMLVGKVSEFGNNALRPLVFSSGQFRQLAGDEALAPRAAA